MWKEETDRLIARLRATEEFRPSSDPDAWDAEVGELDRLCAAVGSANVARVTVAFGEADSSNLVFETGFEWLWMVGGLGWDGLYVEQEEGRCRVWEVEGGSRRPLRVALVAHSVTELLHRALDRAQPGWETGHLDTRVTLVSSEGLDVSELTDLPVTFAAEGDTAWGRGLSWLPPRLFASTQDAADPPAQSAPPPPGEVQIGPFCIGGRWITRGDEVVGLAGYSRVRPVGRSFTGPALAALCWPWVGWVGAGGLGVAGAAALTLGWFGWSLRQRARALRLEGEAGHHDLVLPDDLSMEDAKALTAVLVGVLQLGLPPAAALEVLRRVRSGQ
jgi:hypothetical protein